MGRNECAIGAFETWRFNDHQTHEPVADGWWTHVEDWRRDCPKWSCCDLPAGHEGPHMVFEVES